MPNRAKQQREKRRQNAKDLIRKAGYRLVLGQFLAHQYEMLYQSPILDMIRRKDEGYPRSLARRVTVPAPFFGQSPMAEAIEIQHEMNQVVEFTTRYISMSPSLDEKNKRIEEITRSAIAEFRQHLEDEMTRLAFGGRSPFEKLIN